MNKARHTVVGAVVVLIVAMAGAEASAQSTSRLTDADRKFVMEALEGGQMEVELGKLAEQKATNDAVRKFGERMATDHEKAGQELQELAASKGITAPSKSAEKDKAASERLSKASGAAFDREYVTMMVADHEKDVAEFKKMSREAKDPELKAWAVKTLPTLETHLKMIRQIQKQVATRQ